MPPTGPIASQTTYEMASRFQVELERWDPQSQALMTEPMDRSLETRRKSFGFLGNLEQIQALAPGLFQLIKQFSNKDKATLVAHLPEEIMKMVDEGKLFFKKDSTGKILPRVFDENGGFYKQVCLDWEQMSPDVMDAIRLHTRRRTSFGDGKDLSSAWPEHPPHRFNPCIPCGLRLRKTDIDGPDTGH